MDIMYKLNEETGFVEKITFTQIVEPIVSVALSEEKEENVNRISLLKSRNEQIDADIAKDAEIRQGV